VGAPAGPPAVRQDVVRSGSLIVASAGIVAGGEVAPNATTPPTAKVDGVVGIALLCHETWTVRAGSSVSRGW
jgi:hypothetical protein